MFRKAVGGRMNALPFLVICAGLAAGIFTMSDFGKQTIFLKEWKSGGEIMVVTRESGSGTRRAFLDRFELWEETEIGKRALLTKEAVVVNRSGSLLAAIAGNPYAVGYGSVKDHLIGVKAIRIDSVEPTIEHIQDGSYPYARPFFMAVRKGDEEGVRFLHYVLSEEGQRFVKEAGYLPIEREKKKGEREESQEKETAGKRKKGKEEEREKRGRKKEERKTEKSGKEQKKEKWIISGSSTVLPLASILANAYQEETATKDRYLEVEFQESDSGSGMYLLLQGNADVALLSRELTKEEQEQTIWAAVALDGLVVLVNEQNPIESLTKEEVQRIFMGQERIWR